jgi:hypothetical protein
MNVYQVIFEKCGEDGTITDVVECVECKNEWESRSNGMGIEGR